MRDFRRSAGLEDYFFGINGQGVLLHLLHTVQNRTYLLHQASSKKQKSTALPASEETSHILGIVSSLFSNLPSDSPARIRVLAKFVESNYEKVEKMLELREGAQGRLNDVEKAIEEEKKVCSALYTRH